MKGIPLTKGVTGRWQDNIYNERRQGMPSLQVALEFGVAFGNRVAKADDVVVIKATDASAYPTTAKPCRGPRSQRQLPTPTAVEIHKKTLKIVHLIPPKEESIFQHRTDGTDAFDTLETLAEIRTQRQKNEGAPKLIGTPSSVG